LATDERDRKDKAMTIRSIALASAALFALTGGIAVAQADEQDEQVRQLNIQQLEKAQADRGTTTAPAETMTPDGQGGPELQGPPAPDEGMTDDDDEDATSPDTSSDEGMPPAEDPAQTPPPTTQPE
jgi:hypothetical protein